MKNMYGIKPQYPHFDLYCPSINQYKNNKFPTPQPRRGVITLGSGKTRPVMKYMLYQFQSDIPIPSGETRPVMKYMLYPSLPVIK
jgi:hypothetical protein